MRFVYQIILFFCLGLFLYSCLANTKGNEINSINSDSIKDSIYTPYSTGENIYIGFNSPEAVNTIAKIENEYFNDYQKSVSRYYGTSWQITSMSFTDSILGQSQWVRYLKDMDSLKLKPDSFHCTIYAVKALKAGMGKDFEKLVKLHKEHWGNREFAGWSVAYLLVKYFNWKAYLIIDEYATEYKPCLFNFKKRKCYDVWRQPDIRLEKMLVRGYDDMAIDSLLNKNEFGWGFSNQGIHTWITRYNMLKECRWEGAPSITYDYGENCSPLFRIHNFLGYKDYFSHIVVFPKTKEK